MASASHLEDVLAQGLRTPVAATRAALEALHASLETGSAAWRLVDRALDELARVSQSAEALAEHVCPEPVRPLRCSVRELAQCALAAMPAARRERVWLALEPGAEAVVVDGPLFARSLAALLTRATAVPDAEVLLHAHQVAGVTTFAVVGDLAAAEAALAAAAEGRPAPPRAPAPGPGAPVDVAGDFAAEVGRRAIERLGGEVSDHDLGPHHCLIVRLFDAAGGARP